MFTAAHTFSISVAGITSSKAVTREGDHPNPYQVTLDAAKALTNWVKTDLDTAAGDLAAGHGLTTGTFDVYWDGGQRYGVTCTITVNAVALDGGAGTDFPASGNLTVRISKQRQINTAIDGDAIKIAFVKLGYVDEETVARGRLLFEDASANDIFDLDTAEGLTANKTLIYDVEGGDTNPFTGAPITVCRASHSNTAAEATVTIATLEDSTP